MAARTDPRDPSEASGTARSGAARSGTASSALSAGLPQDPESHQRPPEVVVLPGLGAPAGVGSGAASRRFIPHLQEEAPPTPPRRWVSLSVLAVFIAAGLGLGSSYVLGYGPLPEGGTAVAATQPDATVSDEPLLSKPAAPIVIPDPEPQFSTRRTWTWRPSSAAPEEATPEATEEEPSDPAPSQDPNAGQPTDPPVVDPPVVDPPVVEPPVVDPPDPTPDVPDPSPLQPQVPEPQTSADEPSE